MQLGLLFLVELQDAHELVLQNVRVELVRAVVNIPHGRHDWDVLRAHRQGVRLPGPSRADAHRVVTNNIARLRLAHKVISCHLYMVFRHLCLFCQPFCSRSSVLSDEKIIYTDQTGSSSKGNHKDMLHIYSSMQRSFVFRDQAPFRCVKRMGTISGKGRSFLH